MAASDEWHEFWRRVDSLTAGIRRSKAVNVNSNALREEARQLVQHYFRLVRPNSRDLPEDLLKPLDASAQALIRLAGGGNPRTSYQRLLRDLVRQRPLLETEREILLGERTSGSAPRASQRSRIEHMILDTLARMVPSAALSYEQALDDLAGDTRKSYRGTATELRECLREVLDHLAPDADVTKADGFQFERDKKKPTMRQKVRFILRSRGVGKTAQGTPSAAAQRIEESSAVLARSVYERGSLSTHVSTTRAEVEQLKLYVDGVLAEILQVHADRS